MWTMVFATACASRSACAGAPGVGLSPGAGTSDPGGVDGSVVVASPFDPGPQLPPGPTMACGTTPDWPLWRAYVDAFIQKDGRVIDHTGGGHSTSEGQAYALFHALVANDRATFDKVLGWMTRQLAQGDLGAHLPAWKWGKQEGGGWGVLDENAASDADLWTAYTLYEASRLWKDGALRTLAKRLTGEIVTHEVAELGDLGPTLLPAPFGFAHDDGTYRLNPSYLPVQVLRGMVTHKAPGPWGAITASSVQVVAGSAQHGLAPDWTAWSAEKGFYVDPASGPVGSYDAIRCYLWAGTLHDDDPDKATIATRLGGMVKLWDARGFVPEKVNPPLELAFPTPAPVGFAAALLPDVQVAGTFTQLVRLQQQVESQANGKGLYGNPPTYYDTNLLLFGKGFVDGHYRFEADGHLTTPWSDTCTL